MRAANFSGEKWRTGAVLLRASLMTARFSGRKQSGSRSVMRRVLVGVVGFSSGGRLERSSLRLREAPRERPDRGELDMLLGEGRSPSGEEGMAVGI